MKRIGIDIGGTSIKCGFVDELGNISQRFCLVVDYSLSQEAIIQKLISLINNAISHSSFKKEEIEGIGIGCPGSINSKTGVCDYSNNLRWKKLPIVELVEKGTGFKTRIANDANAAVLGEAKFGTGKRYQNIVLLTLGTGVGGGLFLNGKLYEGKDGKGAELGHSLLVMGGRMCTCGRRGCLEAYASVSALIADTKTMIEKNRSSLMNKYAKENGGINGLTAFECSKLGDEAATTVVNNYIHYLGEGILNFLNIFRPDAVVLGGGLSNQKEYLTNAIKKYLEKEHYGFGGDSSVKSDILVSNLGNDAGIFGASALLGEKQ
jgi:glucokinase